MQNKNDTKTIFGMVLFALSIIMLIYMLITPLNQLAFSVEEFFSLTIINFPIADILNIAGSDINPPLYYLLAKGVAKVLTSLGIGLSTVFALKLMSIIPYAIIIIVSAVKLKSEYGWFASGLFAFAVGVMSEFFTSFLLIRPYAWAILFVVLSFIFLKDIITKGEKIHWILFTAFSVLSAYTYYFAGITSICLYLILLGYILKFEKDTLKNWGISFAAFVILYIPWMLSLINLLRSIHESFWIEAPTLDLIVQSLSYYAYGADTIFGAVTIVILVMIGLIYYLYSKDDETSQFYIASGIGAFVLTIIIGLIISFAFKPVMLAKCLLPAAPLVWLSISIMVSKIEDKKMFTFAAAFIALLLICGVAGTIATSNELYASADAQNQVLENITQDDNAMVILTTPNMIIHFLDYADETDMYCIDTDYIYGENMDRVHQFFDFKDIGEGEIKNLTLNNSDKNIYLISWKDPSLDLNTTKLSSENGVVISKVIVPQTESEEYYY